MVQPLSSSRSLSGSPGSAVAVRSPFVFAVCQLGAEAAAKAEVARLRPHWRLAFSRPGLLTWKCEPAVAPDEALAAVFVRAYGISLGRAGDAAELAALPRPLIYASLGSMRIYNERHNLFRTICDALAGGRYGLVTAVGSPELAASLGASLGALGAHTLLRPYVPQLSVLAAASIFTFRIAWNEFILALVLTDRQTRTLPVAASLFITDIGVDWGRVMAMGSLIAIPPLIFTFVAARQIITGLTAGAVKG